MVRACVMQIKRETVVHVCKLVWCKVQSGLVLEVHMREAVHARWGLARRLLAVLYVAMHVSRKRTWLCQVPIRA